MIRTTQNFVTLAQKGGEKYESSKCGHFRKKKNAGLYYFYPLKMVYNLGHKAEKVQFEFRRLAVPLASRSDTTYNHLPGG